MAEKKKRLDRLLNEQCGIRSRERARALIMSGNVQVNNRVIDKPGTQISADAKILLKTADHPFVSRGGLKIDAALQAFSIDPLDLTCLDVGASTGGFTDCLLQYGAAHVYAVDVGYGQLAWKLRNDPRVTAFERTNIRYLSADALPCRIDLVSIDVAFISLKIVVPAVLKFLRPAATILALIKPQFEAGRDKVGKGGVVRNPVLHDEIIAELIHFFAQTDLIYHAHIPSPILGPKGNREFIIHLTTKTA
jgi:23S rRNA (cytidine1920-2'-O)/16S rRNA (cytidine1409-2'-O)-methyltransferase